MANSVSPVILGYAEPVGKKYRHQTLNDPCISRLGGPPGFLSSVPKLDDTAITCPKCSKLMSLLLQLFAPEGADRPHAYVRLLYVFTCQDGKCAEPGWSKSFKVLRAQSTAVDLQEIDSERSLFELFEIVSEAEPQERPSKASRATESSTDPQSKYQDVLVENDGSEKYVKVKGDAVFYKFNKRLQIAPEQILRYYRSSEVLASSDLVTLWISNEGKLADKDVPNCEHCRGPRSLEFQIMPTTLNYLGLDDTCAESLDWGVLCVYTCNNACDHANRAFVEEKLFRQEYDMKTSIF